MQIAENILHIKQSVPPNIKIVAVSKTVSADAIMEAYQSGHRIFGENRTQDLVKKQALLPADVEWHMIGHLQRNKVKYIAPFVAMIQSVDSIELLSVINREALKNNRTISCLLQLKIAREESKYGLRMEEIISLLSGTEYKALDNIRIKGLMGMASFTDDTGLIRSEFRFLAQSFKKLKTEFFAKDNTFNELSMGMSGDYGMAIQEGATILRIGTLIFGQRE
jgi:hypothetical protein